MDRIEPIGPQEHDVTRIERVVPRRISDEERERREQERRERERRERQQPAPPQPPEDDDGQPHVDVRV